MKTLRGRINIAQSKLGPHLKAQFKSKIMLQPVVLKRTSAVPQPLDCEEVLAAQSTALVNRR
jgi:hypothetical protein